MTQEDKQLLLKDLCARLAYRVRGNVGLCDNCIIYPHDIEDFEECDRNIKPYLRPMSSMTEEERDECINKYYKDWRSENIKEGSVYNSGCTTLAFYSHIDWLNQNHFDYRGLIEKGLAIEAPEGMYKTN